MTKCLTESKGELKLINYIWGKTEKGYINLK